MVETTSSITFEGAKSWFEKHEDAILNLGSESLSTQIELIRQRFILKPIQIYFFGELGRGKTTLINSLLEKEILKASALSITTQNTVHFGDVSKVSTKKINQEVMEESDIRKIDTDEFSCVELTWPINLLRSDIDLVEIPDLNSPEMSAQLFRADIAIMVLSSVAPLSLQEANWIKKVLLSSGFDKIFLVFNRFDVIELEEVDEVKESIQQRVRILVDSEKVQTIFISARQAVQAYERGDKQLLESSGILEFKSLLSTWLSEKGDNSKKSKTLLCIQQLQLECGKVILERKEDLKRDISSTQAKEQQIREKIFRLEEQRQIILDRIAVFCNATTSASQTALSNLLNKLTISKIPGWVNEYPIRGSEKVFGAFSQKSTADLIEKISHNVLGKVREDISKEIPKSIMNILYSRTDHLAQDIDHQLSELLDYQKSLHAYLQGRLPTEETIQTFPGLSWDEFGITQIDITGAQNWDNLNVKKTNLIYPILQTIVAIAILEVLNLPGVIAIPVGLGGSLFVTYLSVENYLVKVKLLVTNHLQKEIGSMDIHDQIIGRINENLAKFREDSAQTLTHENLSQALNQTLQAIFTERQLIIQNLEQVESFENNLQEDPVRK